MFVSHRAYCATDDIAQCRPSVGSVEPKLADLRGWQFDRESKRTYTEHRQNVIFETPIYVNRQNLP